VPLPRLAQRGHVTGGPVAEAEVGTDRDDLELYGVEVEVSFVARIRGMLRFDSVEELVATMAQDVARTRAVLGVDDPR